LVSEAESAFTELGLSYSIENTEEPKQNQTAQNYIPAFLPKKLDVVAQTQTSCLSKRFGFCWQEIDSMHRYEFHLTITAAQYLDYYRGTVRQVLVRCASGQNVQFPASLLQQFVTPEGISGHFALTCDEDHRHSRLERLA